LLIANAPLQVTTLQYSSDRRIKTAVENVDADDLLRKIQEVRIRSYGYTEEWRNVRG
ncbi:hypothetical protein B484DRAFT_300767, partial [Ochromonadaceae sp. CCMP2298]